MYFFNKIFIEIYSWRSSWQYVNIGLGNGLALNRQQAINWTDDDIVYWCIYGSAGLRVLHFVLNSLYNLYIVDSAEQIHLLKFGLNP